MGPLSISASIISLLALVNQIQKIVHFEKANMKPSSKEVVALVDALVNELSDIKLALDTFHDLTSNEKSSSAFDTFGTIPF
jgi:hypothetical protein